jgi:uncharacterized protein
MKPYLVRLTPQTDLKKAILAFCEQEKIETACIISAVGSLSKAVLRTADGHSVIEKTASYELTSLSGTISHGSAHLHCSLVDAEMNWIGGHVMEGCLIHTTMELTIMDLSDEFETHRLLDPQTGYDELVVHHKARQPKKP